MINKGCLRKFLMSSVLLLLIISTMEHSQLTYAIEYSTTVGQPITFYFNSFSPSDPSKLTSYYWDFGDGSTSSEQNPTHTYYSSGTKIVTLKTTFTMQFTDPISHITYPRTVNPEYTANVKISESSGGGGGGIGIPFQYSLLTSLLGILLVSIFFSKHTK